MSFAPHPAVIERRKAAATKAVATRRKRRDARLQHIAGIIVESKSAGPSPKCLICRRTLKDDISVSRGIGTECWQDVLDAIEARRAA
jgi:Family of unknown function (DUF6011)